MQQMQEQQGRVLTTSRRAPTPERWRLAAQRAAKKGIEVRQVNESGMWVANSGSCATTAYVLQISGGIVHSCSCPAMAEWGDSVCHHAAAYYLSIGTLSLPPDADAGDAGELGA